MLASMVMNPAVDTLLANYNTTGLTHGIDDPEMDPIKSKTLQKVVAKLLDYKSWVKQLKDDDIVGIYESYLK